MKGIKIKRAKFLILCIVCIIFITILFHGQVKLNKNNYIICITKSMDSSNGFWQSVMAGAELAAEEYGMEISIRGAEREEDYEMQNKIIEEAITENPVAIILAAADYEKTTEMAKKIKEKNIKLVLVDSEVKDKIADTVIATNNYQAGIKMGAVMKKLLKDADEIGIISHVKGTSTAIDREAGIRMGLTDDKNKIVETVYCDSDVKKAKELTIEMIQKYPNITVIAGLNQYASVGAGNAVKELGLEDTIKIIGFDNAREQIKYLEEGIYKAIVIQKAFNMGYLGVENAVKLIEGKKVKSEIDSGSTLITKENMYTNLNQKLLFPFD